MGQACCKPPRRRSRRLTKIKAEAAAAAATAAATAAPPAASPDPGLVPSQATAPAVLPAMAAASVPSPPPSPPPAGGASDLLHAGRFEEFRELQGQGQTRRKGPRAWLHPRQDRPPRRRLTKPPPSEKKAKKKKKKKGEEEEAMGAPAAVASPVATPPPIVVLEAAPMDSADDRTQQLGGGGGGGGQAEQAEQLSAFAATQLVAPTPRHPVSAQRFPFMHSATASLSTVRSSFEREDGNHDDDSGGGDDDGGSTAGNSPASTSTVIARHGRVVHEGEGGEDREEEEQVHGDSGGSGGSSPRTPVPGGDNPAPLLQPSAAAHTGQRVPTPAVAEPLSRSPSPPQAAVEQDFFDVVWAFMSAQRPRVWTASSAAAAPSGQNDGCMDGPSPTAGRPKP